MKKVALMTWFQHNNYGTTLQSIALTETIKKFGYKVYGVDYVSFAGKRKTKLEKIFDEKTLIDGLKNKFFKLIYKQKLNKTKEIKFNNFKSEYLNMIKAQTLSELSNLENKYDAFICGSDQIWSPNAYDSRYYLDFIENKNKIISYAPSFGAISIQNKFIKKEIKKNIKMFKNLSIREEAGARLIKELTGQVAEVVLDPTLLLSKNEWVNFSKNIKTPSNYLLVYFLGKNEKYWKIIKKIAKDYNKKIVIIPVHTKDFYRKQITPLGIGPGEFLTLIKNADFVCTDSFHGTIFSILYERPFLSFKRFSDKSKNSQNSRIYNIHKILNLKDKFIEDNNFNLKNIFDFNYKEILLKLEKEKQKSLTYLKNSLKKATTSNKGLDDFKITSTCSGCSACLEVCPQKAISVKLNKNGFYEAKINEEKCISCGLCKKVCPFNNFEIMINIKNKKLYMSRSMNEKDLLKSSSGGLAHNIAEYLIDKEYDVIGCTYDINLNKAVHKKVSFLEKEKIAMFQGSKYIQSDFSKIYKEILNSKKAVIFGTPCQIAGLNNFLEINKRRRDYILVDLICHGVPSIYLWKKYLKKITKKVGEIKEVQFRYKKLGWKKLYMYIVGTNKKYKKISKKDLFYNYFELQNCYINSCYECNYREDSKADLRIGDYWGKKYLKYYKTGASMVISMNSKGESILKELKENNKIELIEENIEDYWKVQFPDNPLKPLFYDEIIKELKEDNLDLKKILLKYNFFEHYNKKLSFYYNKIKNIKNNKFWR